MGKAEASSKQNCLPVKSQTSAKFSNCAPPTRPDVQPAQSNDPYSRFIPIQMKRAIFARSKGQCEYLAPNTLARCPSKAHLQIDHVIPLAVGGKTELKNLRHLCPAHNLKAAQMAGISCLNYFPS